MKRITEPNRPRLEWTSSASPTTPTIMIGSQTTSVIPMWTKVSTNRKSPMIVKKLPRPSDPSSTTWRLFTIA